MTTVGALLADVAAALALGAVAALAQPGIELFPAGIVALVAFAWVVARRARTVHAALSGFAFGAALFSAIMMESRSWGANVPALLAFAGAAGTGVPLALWIRASAQRWTAGELFAATAAAWALSMDLLDAIGAPLNFEAASLVALWPPLLGGARLVGANTVSGIVIAGTVCAGVTLARGAVEPAAIGRRWSLAARPLALAFSLLLVFSGLARLTAASSMGGITVGVPQMNVPSEFFVTRQAVPGASDRFDAEFSAQLEKLRGIDLVALTEAYDGRFALDVPSTRARFQNTARLERQAILLTSYLVATDGGGYNAVAGIAANGALVGVHRKVDLAPFGETDLTRGARFEALPVLPGVRAGAMICQESVAPRAARELVLAGANLLVATTSDTSFGSSLLVFGHLGMTRVRAIESGRDVVWASASGPSGVIDRWGEFRLGAPLRVAAPARGRAELFEDRTPFFATSWLWPLLRVALLGVLALRLLPGTTSERAPPAGTSLPRGLGAVVSALAFSGLVSFGAPAVIEWRRGDPARAWSSVVEPWKDRTPDPDQLSYERFMTPRGSEAEGALAFYLDFYGPSRSAVEVTLPPAPVTFEHVLRYLRDAARFPGRMIQLDWERLPRAAAFVRRRDGEYAVLTTNGLGVASLFSPVDGGPIMLRTQQLPQLLEASAILPAGAPDVAPYEP